MQFKVVRYRNKTLGGIMVEGNTVQCLRLMPERTAKGNRRQKVICTIDRWAAELPPEALELLTEAEQAEWVEWKARHDEAQRRKQLAEALETVTGTMEAAAAAVREKAGKPANAAALWAAIEALSGALERAGFGKNKRPRGRPRKETTG